MEKFPFEINQVGWGEFDIGVKIFFVDPAERPVEVTHSLKLYPDPNQPPLSTKRPIVNEKYDEVVFVEPTEYFAYLLDKGPSKIVNIAGVVEEEMKEVVNAIGDDNTEQKEGD